MVLPGAQPWRYNFWAKLDLDEFIQAQPKFKIPDI
jgi:hypothetical protein